MYSEIDQMTQLYRSQAEQIQMLNAVIKSYKQNNREIADLLQKVLALLEQSEKVVK